MSAEQRLDADTLGKVAWEAGQAHMRERYGWPVREYQWSEQVNPDQDAYRLIGQAVAQVVLSAALEAVERHIACLDEPLGIDALAALRECVLSIGAGEVQP